MGVKLYFQGLCMYSEQGASRFGSKAEITSAPALCLLQHGRYMGRLPLSLRRVWERNDTESSGPLGYKGNAQQRNCSCASGRKVHSLLCCKRTQWLPCRVRYLSLIKELSYKGTYCRARSCSDQSRRDEQRWTRSNRSSAVLERSAPPPRSSPKPEVTTSHTGSEKERPQPQLN